MRKLHVILKTLATTAMQQENIWALEEVLRQAAARRAGKLSCGQCGLDGQHGGSVPRQGQEQGAQPPLV